jgi:Mpv17 / PMP22 family
MIGFPLDTTRPTTARTTTTIIKSRIQTQRLFPITKTMCIMSTKCTRGVSCLYMVNTYLAMIDQFVQTSPYTTAAIACGIKASSADFIAQKRQLRKRNENWNRPSREPVVVPTGTTLISSTTTPSQKVKTDVLRNIAFLLYGALYQGMGQEYIYNHLYPLYFGTGTNMVTVLIKVAFDLLIQTTLLTLPVAYGIKAIIYKYTFQEALRRYIDDIMNHGLLIKYFTLWGPVQCMTFGIIPERYRISFIAIVSFFWLIILSTISSRVRSTTSNNMTNATIETNMTDTTTTTSSLSTTPECELVDGLTCNIDG